MFVLLSLTRGMTVDLYPFRDVNTGMIKRRDTSLGIKNECLFRSLRLIFDVCFGLVVSSSAFQFEYLESLTRGLSANGQLVHQRNNAE